MRLSFAQKRLAFEDGSLDPAAFGHRDHIGVAYEMLTHYDFFEALHRYATGIRALAERAGAPDKFHATITLAFISLIAERMSATGFSDAEAFVAANPDLCAPGVLAGWYSQGRLTSAVARRVALLPERPGRRAQNSEIRT